MRMAVRVKRSKPVLSPRGKVYVRREHIRLTPHQKNVVQTLLSAKRPLSTRKIAADSRVRWVTAKRNLEKLKNLGLVQIDSMGKPRNFERNFKTKNGPEIGEKRKMRIQSKIMWALRYKQ